MSNGILNPSYFLGRLLINISTSVTLSSVTLSSVTLDKLVFLGQNSRSKPLLFSLEPHCHAV